MRRAGLATGLLTVLFIVWFRTDHSASQRAAGARSGGRIVPAGGGDHVVRRWGLPAAALINPDNAGSQDFVVVTEAVPAGGNIPLHKHPHAEELILVQQGTATAIVGDAKHDVTTGATIYVPRGEWHGMENRGHSHVSLMGIFSAPGYHTYFEATSVPRGQAVEPFSDRELKAVRERFKDVIVFKDR
jgi:quercetin dioxygenase-like cupin family protein